MLLSMSGDNQKVPLSFLLKKETADEKILRPEISYGEASQSKKGEDFTFINTLGDGVSELSVFALFDGHNGSSAAMYAKENLLSNVLSAMPPDLSGEEWISALPRALVSGFVKTDKDLQKTATSSGTTATFVIIKGWILTVATVGDSLCVLESADSGGIHSLSADHRLETSEEERERVTASGCEVARLNTGGGTEIGPLRCWPGGLCLSRSIGDRDVGEFIVPVPHVKQVKLSSSGGRLIIASDGVWDVLSSETAFDCCRGMPTEAAASQIVKEAVQSKGLLDDTTCIVVDIQPQERPDPPKPPMEKQGSQPFKSMFRRKPRSSSSQSSQEEVQCKQDSLEELFEEGSALLSERLNSKYPVCNMFKLFVCAICQVGLKPGEGFSIHSATRNPRKPRPWQGPLLCLSCQEKKEAMEAKKAASKYSARSVK